MPSILSANTLSSGGYNVSNSLRLNAGDNPSAAVSQGTPTNVDKYTFSVWVKRADLGAANSKIFSVTSGGTYGEEKLEFNQDDLIWRQTEASEGNTNWERVTDRKFRDPSAWYHIVVAYDSTDGTAANRAKMYINGVQETSFSGSTNPGSGADSYTNTSGRSLKFFALHGNLNDQNNGGYFSEMVYIDGQQLPPTDFGEFDSDSGIWKPIDVSGLTFGNNGFYLEFKETGTSQNASGIGADTSGNGNHVAVTNITATDISTDTCTNNFATFNGSLKQMSTMALTEGNLQGATSSSHEAFFGSFFSSIGVTTGKWYAEFKCTGNANRVYVGISSNLEADILGSSGSAYTFAYKGNGWAYGGQDGKIAHTNSNTFLDYGAALSNNDILGVALDLDELEIYFSVNGTFQNSGDPTSGSSQTGGVVTAGAKVLNGSGSTGTYYFCVSDNDQSTVCTVQANFGSPIHSISSGNADGNGFGNFEYAVPSGYLALCTKNLAENG